MTSAPVRPSPDQPPVPQPDGAMDHDPAEQSTPEADAQRLADALRDKLDKNYDKITPEMARVVGDVALKPLTFASIDQSQDAEMIAREEADRRYTEMANGDPKQGRLRKFVSGIWRNNQYLESYRRWKYKKEALEEIAEDQDIYTHIKKTDEEGAKESRNALFERMTTTWSNEVIHEGEKRDLISDEDPFSKGVKDLVRRYVVGEFNDKSLEEAKKRFYAEYPANNPESEIIIDGIAHTDNMSDVARRAKEQVDEMVAIAEAVKGSDEYKQSVDYVLENMQVMSAEARTGARTEVNRGAFERVVDRLEDSVAGRFVSPETLAVSASVAAVISKVSFSGALKSIGLIGVGAGALGYMRERKRVNDDRQQHARDRASGQVYETGSKRREEMEGARYTTESAVEMTDGLSEAFAAEKLDAGGRDALEVAIAALTKAELRKQLSDQRNIDLISYSKKTAIERERLNLDIEIAKAKVELKDRLANGGDVLLGREGATVESLVSDQTDAYKNYLESINQDITTKDEAFRKLRRRRSRNAAATVFATTAVIGGSTLLASAAVGGFGTEHHGPSGNFSTQSIGKLGEIKISDDHSIVQHDGNIDIVGHDGAPVEGLTNLEFDENGTLAKEAVDSLRDHGMTVRDAPSYTTESLGGTTTSSIQEYMRQPNNGTTHVTRDFWYDNNTPYTFEGNEQGLHMGGVNGSGVTENGAYQYKLSLSQGGSFHGSQVAQLDSSQLKIAISADAGSQHQVFMVDVKSVTDASGNRSFVADIDPNSPAASLYSSENGRMAFHGAYAELVEVKPPDTQGVTHMRPLATHVGDSTVHSLTHTTPPVTVEHPTYTIITNGYETDRGLAFVAAPITTRKALENVQETPKPQSALPPAKTRAALERAPERKAIEAAPAPRATVPEGSQGSGNHRRSPLELVAASERAVDRMDLNENSIRDRKRELRRDPSAKIELNDALNWHYTLLRNKDPEYVQSIENIVETSKSLEKLGVDTDVIVPFTINVSESATFDKLYDRLKEYGESSRSDGGVVRLLLNAARTDDGQGEDLEKINEIQELIDRARRTYPNLKISYFDMVISRTDMEQGKYGGRSLQEIADQRLYDVTMLATLRAIRSEEREADKDILVVRRDLGAASQQGNDERMLEAMHANPSIDMFSGGVRWDRKDIFKESPSNGFVMQFLNAASLVDDYNNRSVKPLLAVNMGYRLSTLAAIGGGGHYTDKRQGATSVRTYDLTVAERVTQARNNVSRGVTVSSDDGQKVPSVKQARKFMMLVNKARVNMDSRSFENARHKDGSILSALRGVETGISVGSVDGSVASTQEDTHKKPHVALRRVEDGISDAMNSLHMTEGECRAALALLLPSGMYILKEDADGRKIFRLTSKNYKDKDGMVIMSGRAWLLKDFKNNPSYRR